MSKENVDIKYELIPYDGFIGSKEFDFDKVIYDLNSQIELLSSQADNLDYVIAIASGIACGLRCTHKSRVSNLVFPLPVELVRS